MLSVDKGREAVTKVRDQLRSDDSNVDDLLRERGVDPETIGNLRVLALMTLGEPGVALVDASVLAGVTLGQAAAAEQAAA